MGKFFIIYFCNSLERGIAISKCRKNATFSLFLLEEPRKAQTQLAKPQNLTILQCLLRFLINISANYKKRKSLSLRCIWTCPHLSLSKFAHPYIQLDFPSYHQQAHTQTNVFLSFINIGICYL